MSTISNFRTSALIAIALSAGAFASTVTPAAALELTVVASRACPAGTHLGYEGKYCWPNRGRACPAGYHLGYEGKYCCPNN